MNQRRDACRSPFLSIREQVKCLKQSNNSDRQEAGKREASQETQRLSFFLIVVSLHRTVLLESVQRFDLLHDVLPTCDQLLDLFA